ncbi:Multiple stress resistance protein BhsA precursor [Yersinia enterocolitica]|uniref:YdgH/BhsA/McbA-like domain containing protein n=1 Tax=Yersinia enterocolitica TaxID=630 RepID=UPI0005E1EC53|nr:YdgH/BhsA/McbA-like domain containing protein [Yersinia enterocolitica]CQD71668.1 Multiple stress resistance protein BhsA precursor [Yersinia enterocolitica]
MKILKTMAMLVVLGTFSSAVISAELLTKEELNNNPQQYEKIGNIVTANELATMDAKAELATMDAKAELSKKADELGGDYYVITSANTDNKIHATADVYKKK